MIKFLLDSILWKAAVAGVIDGVENEIVAGGVDAAESLAEHPTPQQHLWRLWSQVNKVKGRYINKITFLLIEKIYLCTRNLKQSYNFFAGSFVNISHLQFTILLNIFLPCDRNYISCSFITIC